MKHHKLFYGSSYDRGLKNLLMMWSDIREAYPEATLSVAYGWDLFDKAYSNNKERQEWKKLINQLLDQDGITHYGRVGKEQLKTIRSKCGIWAYPTDFTEINCITALETQNDGLVPVTMSLGALKETACKGILIDKDINTIEAKEEFLEKLLTLMGDKKEWKRLSNKCSKFARKYDWSNISTSWNFEAAPVKGKVSIYTPTLRNGWWNIMAANLASQTHKNFEWIIVDGQEKSRESIAKKYAKAYNLDIKYIHQGKTKRTYGLSNANNLAIEAATGDLFVFLQDFVLITPTALEELLRVSNQHPGDFIAPVDITFTTKMKPDLDNTEDWFNEETDVVGDVVRKNVRAINQGIRKSDVVTDFEQNYGAVPLSTLKELNGYWEFYDEALGWDDTEIIYRAKALGYNLWVDDTNQCVCLDHHQILGKDEGGTSVNRARRLNNPRFAWMLQQIELENLPLVRDPEIEKSIDLQYTIPQEISDDECDNWVKTNTDTIVKGWADV